MTKEFLIKNLATYFLLEIPDTISLGRNLAKVKLYNSNFRADLNLITIIVNNQYSENKYVKDTFSDGTLKPLFGIYGYKTGKQKIEGIIEETILFDKVKNKDTILVIQKHLKYFEKNIYVKDTVDNGVE